MQLLLGDCLEILPTLGSGSIDSIVTDPPYGLRFMGKRWDYRVPSIDVWKECHRVLKPGGHLLAFGGTRTYHRLVVAIEDAGFEIRDQIQWIYGQGFPKSQDISKAIDRAAGAEREVIRTHVQSSTNPDIHAGGVSMFHETTSNMKNQWDITAPATLEAQKWSGWGTALKPANEPICLARKPLSESTVAKNVLRHGTGGLNIDGSRIHRSSDDKSGWSESGSKASENRSMSGANYARDAKPDNESGRFPANVIFDSESAKVLDEQSGMSDARGGKPKKTSEAANTFSGLGSAEKVVRNDSGGASRFFYCAKASKSERGEGNTHPTVKPIKLMEYLIKLITPPGGIILDPFAGSGTTGIAAANLGFDFIGIELNAEYFKISEQRICR